MSTDCAVSFSFDARGIWIVIEDASVSQSCDVFRLTEDNVRPYKLQLLVLTVRTCTTPDTKNR